jgi:hypothetical protein
MNPLINKTARFFKFGMFAIQAAAVVIALYETYKKSQQNVLPPHKDADLRSKFANGKRDIIEESSWQSFPASDPPASNKFT